MHDRAGLFTSACAACLVCAAAVVYLARFTVPLGPTPWQTAFSFFVCVLLTDFLAVALSDTRGSVAPTAPVHWIATCVLGPFVAAIVCSAAALLGRVGTCTAFYITNSRTAQQLRRGSDTAAECGEARPAVSRAALAFLGYLDRLAANWYLREFRGAAEAVAMHVGTVGLSVGVAGLVYHYAGGQFIGYAGLDSGLLRDFALPFLALVSTAILVEEGQLVVAMVIVDPVRGVRGVYGVLLRAKLALVEMVMPLWGGNLFLMVVALLLSYLYIHIGMWGFVLGVMPVLALRDFFHQWVETKAAYLDTVTTLATYMQHYHPYTRGHLKRVAEMSERLARELRLPIESIRHINAAGFMHDIGKIGVSEEILDKTEKLTDDEWNRIKEHPVKGAEIVSHLEFLECIVDWVKYHHKWHNGGGYPAGNGDAAQIPIEAAIIAAADAFDAMTDDREMSLEWQCDSCGYKPDDGHRPDVCPECGADRRRMYREPKSLDQAIDELRRGAGSQFHPEVVKAFLTMVARDGIRLNV